MEVDVNKRVEWLSKRMDLEPHEKEYIKFQMKEIVMETVGCVNKSLKERNTKLLIDFSNFLKLELDKDFDNEFLVNEYISKSLNK